VQITRLDAKQRELLSIGITGVIGVGLGLWALVFPAFGVLFLTEGGRSMAPDSRVINWAVIVTVTALIAVELVLASAAIRMTFTGRWPGRSFLLGRPAAAISLAAFAFAAVLAVLL
jgi:hypothetical protein